MAHDIIGKLSAEVRAARLGISAFSPHREEHGLPRTGNSTVRDFLLALCDMFCATNQSSAILKWPSGWCGSLECINRGVSQPKGFTTHEVTHGPQPGTLKEHRLQVHSTCYKFIPLSNSFEDRRTDLVNERHHMGHMTGIPWDFTVMSTALTNRPGISGGN